MSSTPPPTDHRPALPNWEEACTFFGASAPRKCGSCAFVAERRERPADYFGVGDGDCRKAKLVRSNLTCFVFGGISAAVEGCGSCLFVDEHGGKTPPEHFGVPSLSCEELASRY